MSQTETGEYPVVRRDPRRNLERWVRCQCCGHEQHLNFARRRKRPVWFVCQSCRRMQPYLRSLAEEYAEGAVADAK